MDDLLQRFEAVRGADEEGGELLLADFDEVRGVGAVIAANDEEDVQGLLEQAKEGVLPLLRGSADGIEDLEIGNAGFGAVAVEDGLTLHSYWSSNCQTCALHDQCTTGKERRVRRWEHEAVVEAMERRLDRTPEAMRIRRQTVEHPFGTLKDWMGATHFLTRTLERVSTEMSLHVLAYNLKRVIKIIGIADLKAAMQA